MSPSYLTIYHLSHTFLHSRCAPGDAILQRCAFLRAAPGTAGTAGTAQRSGHDVATVAVVPEARVVGNPQASGFISSIAGNGKNHRKTIEKYGKI